MEPTAQAILEVGEEKLGLEVPREDQNDMKEEFKTLRIAWGWMVLI